MFDFQRIRLLRDDWNKAKDLAEELYAMLGAKDVAHEGTLSLDKGVQAKPYFNLRNYQEGSPVFSITGKNGQKLGDIALSGGNLVFTETSPAAGPNNRRPTSGGGGGGLPGKVVSGTGANYVVDIYPNGLASSPIRVNATQAGIDPTATIPADSWGPVVQTGTSYVMLFPLWA